MGVIVTLTIFVFVFIAFLIAPLLALAFAFLGYAVMRPRDSTSQASGPAAAPGQGTHGFGAGTR